MQYDFGQTIPKLANMFLFGDYNAYHNNWLKHSKFTVVAGIQTHFSVAHSAVK